jgi:predicted ATPase
MRLKRFAITSYSSFENSGWIDLDERITIFVGANNVGKSALLRVFDYQITNDPHRNNIVWQTERLINTKIEYEFILSGRELETAILRSKQVVQWPVAQGGRTDATLINEITTTDTLLELQRVAQSVFHSRKLPAHGRYTGESAGHSVLIGSNNGALIVHGLQPGVLDNLISVIDPYLKSKIFYFSAERLSIGTSPQGRSERLTPNASNLPQVLMYLSGEYRDLLVRIVNHMRELFATVGSVTVRTTGDQFEVLIWPTEEVKGVEFSVPLNNSGTGVAQALAIITAMATATDQSIIVIDELATFLHPAASKALVRLMQTHYPHHQYVISTHSPEVISTANLGALFLVRKQGYESILTKIDASNIQQVREIATQLGISMTDVFGADHVIWVEGQTEELCFPLLYERIYKERARGIAFIAVIATGDFFVKKPRKELIIEIYSRLSEAASPLISRVMFSFDREDLTREQRDDLVRSAPGKLSILPRRHLECYLVDPDAIHALLLTRVPELGGRMSASRVEECLRDKAGARKYRAEGTWANDLNNQQWLSDVDAANLIKDVCSELSGSAFEFEKKNDSLELLKYILEHKPEKVDELRDYVDDLVKA